VRHPIPFEDHFHVDRRQARKLLTLGLAHGADFAELYFEYRLSSFLSLEENILKGSGGGVSLGLGVRVLAGERTGYAYTDDLTPASMEEAARTAAHIAAGPVKEKPARIKAVKAPRRYPVELPVHLTPLKDKIRLVERANTAARNLDRRINQVMVGLSEGLKYIRVINSDGLLAEDVLPMCTFNCSAIAQSQHGPQRGTHSGGGRVGMEFFHGGRPEVVAVVAAEQAIRLCEANPAPAGKMPVVLAAGDSGVLLHEAVGHGLEADFNRKGSSNYSGMVGKRVASKLCTIVDDGTLENNRGTLDLDDEGTVPGSTVLIEDGILRGYMQDRISAKAMDTESTGNGRRQSYAHIPQPRMTNTYMLAGNSHPEEIIRSVKKGVYAVRYGGGQVDISNGEFTFNVTEGYLIENGRITAPIRGAQLIGNGPDVLGKISMVGNDLKISEGQWTCGKRGQSVPVGVGMPTCKVSSITVGGTGQ
jgi:TldD protein